MFGRTKEGRSTIPSTRLMGMDSSPPWAMSISSIDHQFVAFAQKEIDAGKKTAIARLDVDATPGGTNRRDPAPTPPATER